MCTVTYFPQPDGFVLTHNRDEAPLRSQPGLERARAGGHKILLPRDAKAGGSWIAASDQGDVVCLLNGAFVKHRHEPPYRRSRGLMLLDFFDYPNADAFFRQYECDDMEPFTFLFFNRKRVVQWRWDGQQKHLLELNPGAAHFWCSATLYPPEMQQIREQVFRDALPKLKRTAPRLQASALLKLHQSGSVGDPENDYIMNRGGRVCTVSITQVRYSGQSATMRYLSLPERNLSARSIVF